jgi:hypothetical protein
MENPLFFEGVFHSIKCNMLIINLLQNALWKTYAIAQDGRERN